MTSRPKRGAGPSLFAAAGLDHDAPRPLADKLRPQKLADVVGQDHLLGPDGALTRMLDSVAGLAGVLGAARHRQDHGGAAPCARDDLLRADQAIFSGVADLKKVFDEARARRETGQGTLLFVDEIHRFNRAQQDSFLPVMEDGTIVLVGATTENPSFELNAPLLSRARVLVFKSLDAGRSKSCSPAPRRSKQEAAARRGARALAHPHGRRRRPRALTLAEEVWRAARTGEMFDPAALQKVVQRRAPIYDKSQDGHYNLISALHKSVRGSDPDAALYYLAPHARRRGGPALSRAPRRADGGRGHRPCRSAGAGDLQRRQGSLRLPRLARGRTRHRRSRDLRRDRAEIERGLRRLRRGQARRQGRWLAAAAQAHPQRADQADEVGGLRPRLRLRPRRRGGVLRPGLFPGGTRPPEFYDPPERGFEREIRKRLDYWAKLRKDKAGD